MPRAVSPYDGCISWDQISSLPGMSINIVLLGSDDIVIGSDGLSVDENEMVVSEKTHKACRLNNRLCFVSSGSSLHARVILAALDRRAAALDSEYPEDDWERRKCRTRHSFQEARSIISSRYCELFDYMSQPGEKPLDSAFFLCGWDRTATVACFRVVEDQDGKRTTDIQSITTQSRIQPFTQGIPKEHPLYEKVAKRLYALASLHNAEGVLVDVISHAATAAPEFKANTNILTRRLSDKFRAHWHDPPSSLREQDPSMRASHADGDTET